MRILKLHIHNFKVFDDIEFDFSGNDATILCGRNGFGKTTIFDASELLFTGTIKRYENYTEEYHEKKYIIYGKQLIHDESVNDIFIEALVEIKPHYYSTFRIVGDKDKLNVPVNFSEAFHWDSHFVPPKELGGFSHYTRLNYMSQDESTEFLKRKESDRSKQIETLFKTDKFDQQIERVGMARKGLRDVKKEYEVEKVALGAYEEGLKKIISQQKTDNQTANNIPIFNPETVAWDGENPSLNVEEIDAIIQEGGELDNIKYYIEHREDYQNIISNNKLYKILQQPTLHQIAFYYKYHESVALLEQYRDYKNGYLKYYNSLAIDNIANSPIVYKESLQELLPREAFKSLENLRKRTADILLSASRLQLSCNRIIESRRQIENDLSVTEFSRCPVCGTDFGEHSILLAQVSQNEQIILREANQISQNTSETFSNYKKTIKEMVIDKMERYFADNHINNDILDDYDRVKFISTKDEYRRTIQLIGDSIPRNLDIDKLEMEIQKRLLTLVKDIDESVNRELLQQVAARYGKYLRNDLKGSEIELKRKYLSGYQFKLCVEQRKKNTLEFARIDKLLKKCQAYDENLLGLEKVLKQKRAEYVEKVISDIEVLFYIYSGRIMQDSFYGRGVFMRRDLSSSSVSRIIFVTGSYQNNVDVLYNMSSGQIISVAIAFLLALNKLYDNLGFLAIDDPVQTIDDINLWGLIETIRHEFYDKSLLLSTHEGNSAALIRYKLSMIGRNAYALDMGSIYKE